MYAKMAEEADTKIINLLQTDAESIRFFVSSSMSFHTVVVVQWVT
jgi:hypothetical protein